MAEELEKLTLYPRYSAELVPNSDALLQVQRLLVLITKKCDNQVEKVREDPGHPNYKAHISKLTKKPMVQPLHYYVKHYNALKKKYKPFAVDKPIQGNEVDKLAHETYKKELDKPDSALNGRVPSSHPAVKSEVPPSQSSVKEEAGGGCVFPSLQGAFDRVPGRAPRPRDDTLEQTKWRQQFENERNRESAGPYIPSRDWIDVSSRVPRFDRPGKKDHNPWDIGNPVLRDHVNNQRERLFNDAILEGVLEFHRYENAKRSKAKFGHIRDVTIDGSTVRMSKDKKFKYPADYRLENLRMEDIANRMKFLMSVRKTGVKVEEGRSKNVVDRIKDWVERDAWEQHADEILRATDYSEKTYNALSFGNVDDRKYKQLKEDQKRWHDEKPKDSHAQPLVDMVFFHENEINNKDAYNGARDKMRVRFKVELGVDGEKNEAVQIQIYDASEADAPKPDEPMIKLPFKLEMMKGETKA